MFAIIEIASNDLNFTLQSFVAIHKQIPSIIIMGFASIFIVYFYNQLIKKHYLKKEELQVVIAEQKELINSHLNIQVYHNIHSKTYTWV